MSKKNKHTMSLEDKIIKLTGVILTLFVVVQIVAKEGVHVYKVLKASLLESYEITETHDGTSLDSIGIEGEQEDEILLELETDDGKKLGLIAEVSTI